jgi:2',3'-cyclic-nucleotide 2'-phosphodiesterase (5'-nucleotidase family)
MKAEHMVELYKTIGVDAVNIGEFDLALGIGYLKELAKKTDFPFISANLVDAGGAAIFPRYIIKKVGNKNVGILGLIADTGDIPGKVKEITKGEASVTDAVAAATAVVEELKGKVDYIVALTHQQANRDWIIARRVGGIDVVVGGHDKQRTEDPLVVDDKTLIVRAGEKGQYLGMFEADLDAKMKFTHNLVHLGDDIADDAKIKKIITDYNDKIFDMYSGGGETGVNPAANVELQNEKCSTCHANQMTKWKTTDHAKAYNTLFDKAKNYDPTCLACHTVRFEQPNGFNMKDQPMSLVHVQCEACHGDAKEHLASFQASAIPVRKPTVDVCAKCHTSDRNPNLVKDQKIFMDKIKH